VGAGLRRPISASASIETPREGSCFGLLDLASLRPARDGTHIQSGSLAALAALALAAGCLGGETEGDPAEPTASEAPEDAEAAGDPSTSDAAHGAELSADDRVEAADWQVGQHFGYHVYFDANDTEGQHFDFAVAEDRGDAWLVATENRTLSKYAAVSGFPLLGTFDKADLSTSVGDDEFRWYDWPLHDGKNWTEETEVLGDTYEVTYEPAIQVDRTGHTHPGFSVVGTTSEGEPFREYDYVPAIG